MSTPYEEYDLFEYDEPAPVKPVSRQLKLPHCVHCPDREVTSDGKAGWVHNDDYKYSCDLGNPDTTFAAATLATGGVVNANRG